MAAMAGKDVSIEINTTGSTYVAIGGMRTNSIKIAGTEIDITTADSSGRWRELLGSAGVISCAISGAGVFLNDTACALALTKVMLGASLGFKFKSAVMGTFAGSFMVKDFTLGGTHNGEVTFDLSLESAGAITYTAP
jgi:TP901-1 family phage major tail protein